jgi:hypothetical protein
MPAVRCLSFHALPGYLVPAADRRENDPVTRSELISSHGIVADLVLLHVVRRCPAVSALVRVTWQVRTGPRWSDCYFGVSFNSLLVGGVFGLIEDMPLSVRT